MNTSQVHQKIVDLLALSARHLEVDLPSIRAHADPGSETESAMIRSLEFSLKLVLQAAELAEEETMRLAIGERAAKIEAAIAICRANIVLWASQAEARESTKH